MQDFTATPLANAYMVQPPLLEGVWKSVRVPLRRVHDFWNITDGYERVNNNALEPGCFGWQMEIIRSTVELVEDVNFKWIKREGADYRDYFEFAITEGVEGNIILLLFRFKSSTGCIGISRIREHLHQTVQLIDSIRLPSHFL